MHAAVQTAPDSAFPGMTYSAAAAPSRKGNRLPLQHARQISRYESRVHTLKEVRYLSPEGKVTPSFRVHYCVRRVVVTHEVAACSN
jgi:hypothetical protein